MPDGLFTNERVDIARPFVVSRVRSERRIPQPLFQLSACLRQLTPSRPGAGLTTWSCRCS